MDIAASYPVKQPVRYDAGRDAPMRDDPYSDDFDAELTRATKAESEPARPEKSKTAKSEETASSDDAPSKSENDPDAHGENALAPSSPIVAAPPVKPATVQVSTGQQPTAGATEPDSNSAQLGSVSSGVVTEAALLSDGRELPGLAMSMAAAETTAKVAPVPSPSETQAVADPKAPAAAGTPAPALAIAAPETLAAAQPQPAKPAQSSKKPLATVGKPEAAQAPAAPSPTPQTGTQTPIAAGQAAQGGAQKNAAEDGGAKSASIQAASAAPAHAYAAQDNPQEFKLDASAAVAAPQPASIPAPNAPAMAPALVAQNAPIIVPPEALGVTIARKALEGVNKFELRLDPPELGRVDVTLEVDDTGTTRAHIRAERPEALELLQREAKGMEQALRQAGLQFDQSSLTFSLGGREGREAQEHGHNGRRAKFNAVLPEDEIRAGILRGGAPQNDGLDLRV